MALHVMIGAGSVGSSTALLLVSAGFDVRIITRSGSGPEHPGIERIAADASHPTLLSKAAAGAAVLYNCASSPYAKWASEWPPLANSVLNTAEKTGAVLVTMSNLYGYGPVHHPMTESDPLAAA